MKTQALGFLVVAGIVGTAMASGAKAPCPAAEEATRKLNETHQVDTAVGGAKLAVGVYGALKGAPVVGGVAAIAGYRDLERANEARDKGLKDLQERVCNPAPPVESKPAPVAPKASPPQTPHEKAMEAAAKAKEMLRRLQAAREARERNEKFAPDRDWVRGHDRNGDGRVDTARDIPDRVDLGNRGTMDA